MTADPITCRIRNHEQVLGIRHADPLREQCIFLAVGIRPPTGNFFAITIVGKSPSGLLRITVKKDDNLDNGIRTYRGRRTFPKSPLIVVQCSAISMSNFMSKFVPIIS